MAATTEMPSTLRSTTTHGRPVTDSEMQKAVNDMPQNDSANLTAATSPPTVAQQNKPKKTKKERKNAAEQNSEDVQGATTTTASKRKAAPSTADTLLFQRLAQNMTNGLMNAGGAKAPPESLDLVSRLSSAALKSTTKTNVTTTTTTTTTELNITLEKGITAASSEHCSRRMPVAFSSDSDSDIENAGNAKSAFSHISNQATKLSHLLPAYQVGSYAARQANLMTTSRKCPSTFTLGDFAAIAALESLAERYGRVSHMGILDPSYTFFINQARTAALYYKSKSSCCAVFTSHD